MLPGSQVNGKVSMHTWLNWSYTTNKSTEICLTHWGWVTHICVGDLTIIIVSDNGLSTDRCQAITWTNAGILLIGPWGTKLNEWNFNQNTNIFIHENAFENIVCETAAILFRPQCVNIFQAYPDSKVHGAIMGPIWGRQDPGGPHVGPMNFVIWVLFHIVKIKKELNDHITLYWYIMETMENTCCRTPYIIHLRAVMMVVSSPLKPPAVNEQLTPLQCSSLHR